MAPRLRPSSLHKIIAGLAALSLVGTGCAQKEPKPTVVGSLGFDQRATTTADTPIIKGDPGLSCGTQSAEFGAELVDVDPTRAKVQVEWG
ncbi:MAG: hypothetical protein E6G40_13475, partial [Actinobacteria bacterium]